MKKVLSIIVALSLLLSMVAVTITTVGATDNKDLENSTQYLIHELDRTQAGVIDGVVHGYMGDPDNDGDITIMDATEIQLFVARIKIPDEITSLLANVDNDDEVSIMDATQIQLYVARVISSDIINHALYTPYPPTEPPTEAPTQAPTISPEKGSNLTVWAPYSAVDIVEDQCKDFIAQYPNSNIRITVEAQGEGDAAFSLINDPYSSADVFGFACDQLNRLDDAKVILPVSTILESDIKSRNTDTSVSAATINNTLLAYPETADSGYYLVYDQTYVSNEDAKTLEGVLKACRKAKKKFVIDAGNGFYACMFPFTGGLKIEGFEDEAKEIQKFNDYDEAQVVATMQAFAKLFHEYSDVFYITDPYKISDGFSRYPTTVAAGIDGSWNIATVSSILGYNFGAAKLPTINVNGEDRQIVSMHGYKMMGVNAYTRYPYASQLLADYLTNEQCQLERARYISWGPSNKEAAKSAYVTSDPALSAILEQSLYSVPQTSIAPTFWDPMGNLGNNLCNPNSLYDTATLTRLLNWTINNIKYY